MQTSRSLARLWILGLVGVIASAETSSAGSNRSPTIAYDGFIPIDPLPFPSVRYVDGAKELTAAWAELSNSAARRLLPNQTASIVVQTLDQNTNARYLAAAFSGRAGLYRVVMDYAKFRVEEVKYQDQQSVLGRIGVGLRIQAEIRTSSSNIDLGSLIALGVAAKQGHLKGKLTVDVIGLDSSEITQLFPLPSQIDETSIQKALEAIAAIKAKLSDPDTTLTPQVMAVKVGGGLQGPTLDVATARSLFQGAHASTRVLIGCLELIEDDASGGIPETISLRDSPVYVGARAPLIFAASISGLGLDDRGMLDAELTIVLENENSGLAEIGHRQLRESPDQWRSKVPIDVASQIESLKPSCAGPVKYMAVLKDRADLGLGTLKLRLSVLDRVTGAGDSKTVPVTFMAE